MKAFAAALLCSLLVGCGTTQPPPTAAQHQTVSPNPGSSNTASSQTFRAAGLSFQIPSTWHAEAMDEPFHYERLLGYVGDGTWKLTCPPGAQPGEFNTCTVSTDLASDTVAVRVSENQGPPTPGPDAVEWVLTSGPGASPLTVGGLPAAVQTVAAPAADEAGLRWTLTVPGYPIRSYTLTALIRGPDYATVRAELDAMVQSVTITPGTIGTPAPSSTPLRSPTLAAVRADIESRYMDQLLSIGDGAEKVILRLKPTATAAAAEIVGRYGWAVQVTVGFFPYPPPSSAPAGCGGAPLRTVDPGPLRAVIKLPSPPVGHGVDLPAKVRLTNTGSTTLTIDTGQPLSIYLFAPGGTAPVGAFPGGIAGTGLVLRLLPRASQEIDAVGGTASCDLRLGYELPDGPYVARAAVEIDGTSGPGYFWSDPVSIQLTTP